MSRFADQLEKKINGKIKKISNGTLTIKEAGLNKMIERLKEVDEAAAEELNQKYIDTVKELNKNNKS